jgi:hypothetical protein
MLDFECPDDIITPFRQLRCQVDLQVVIAAMTNKQIIPGTIPSVCRANGIPSTPSPIWVFIMSTDVPIHPTLSSAPIPSRYVPLDNPVHQRVWPQIPHPAFHPLRPVRPGQKVDSPHQGSQRRSCCRIDLFQTCCTDKRNSG